MSSYYSSSSAIRKASMYMKQLFTFLERYPLYGRKTHRLKGGAIAG